MVSAIDQLTAKLGEKKNVQQLSGNHETIPEHQHDEKAFILNCLSQRQTKFLRDILSDETILNLARYMRLRSMSQGSVATYLANISKVCKERNTSPIKLVEQLKQLGAKELQIWFTGLAENYLFRSEKPVRGSTMRTTHFALIKLLKANDVAGDILEQVKAKFRVRKRKPLAFTRDEVKAILKTASGSRRDTLWIWLLCQSFGREGVIYTLTYADFMDTLESGREAGLIWIDGEQRRTKERTSHDLPISPEVVKALKARRQEIETKYGLQITKANADQFPIVSYENQPTKKMGYPDFLAEVRLIIHRAGVQGSSYGSGSAKRYTKDVHTGFRGFCFSQWKGNNWLAKYFAGQVVHDAFNYVQFETVDQKEKIADYLQFRPRPFDEEDMVQEACVQLANLGFAVDSKIRKLLERQLPGGERGFNPKDRRTRHGEDALQEKGRSKCLYDGKMRESECFHDFSVVQTPPSSTPIFHGNLLQADYAMAYFALGGANLG